MTAKLTMQQLREKAIRDGVPTWAVDEAERRAERAREKEEPGALMVQAGRAAFAAAMREYEAGTLASAHKPRTLAALVQRAKDVGTPADTLVMAQRAHRNAEKRLQREPLLRRMAQCEAAFLTVVREELDMRRSDPSEAQLRVLRFMAEVKLAVLVEEVRVGLSYAESATAAHLLTACLLRGYVRAISGRAAGGRAAKRYTLTSEGRTYL